MQAVIFDMDGVIVDSELQWQLSEKESILRWAPAWREEDYRHITGLSPQDLYGFLAQHYGLRKNKQEFLQECQLLAEDIYLRRVSLEKTLLDVLGRLKDGHIAAALASSSPRAWINLVLERFELKKWFPIVVSADDVGGRGKPCPDIHSLACRLLDLAPAQCLAVEDSQVGVSAAKKAGLRCAAFRNGSNGHQDLSAADFEVRSLAELMIEGVRP